MNTNFTELLSSAAKVVFMAIGFAACVALFTGHLESQDFMVLASMAFGFFFAYKGDDSKPYQGK